MDTKTAVEKIVDSIKECQKDNNFVLISEDWGNYNRNCACAIGCVLKLNKKSFEESPTLDAAHLLNVSSDWIEAFTSGYDETPWDPNWLTVSSEEKKILIEANEAGHKLKDQFKPLKYDSFTDTIKHN